MLEQYLAFSKELGRRRDEINHVVRISCMGADTNTASYNADQHASRAGAGIPLMLQHYWWGEKALTNGFYTRCSPDFYNLTGHKPTSYYDYLTPKRGGGGFEIGK